MIDPVTATAAAESAGAKSAGSKAAADGASIVNPMTATAAESFPVAMSGTDLPFVTGATNYGASVGTGLAEPAVSFLGLSPGQWGQQALFQGGGALLKGMGANQVEDRRNSSLNRYNQFIDEGQPARDAAFSNALTPFDRAKFDKDLADRKAAMMAEYDATAPTFTFANEPDSTPQEVKSDIARKTTAARDRSRSTYSALTDLNALSSLLGLNRLNTAEQAQNMGLASAANKTALGQLTTDLEYANGAGSMASGLGDMTSSIGNLVLANQLTKKKG